jgi:uncharacterized protein with FMN-binding domain
MKGKITMKSKSKLKRRREGKRKMSGWIIALIIVAVLGAGGAIGWSFLSKEHAEAKNLPIAALDFRKLKDGDYIGEYAGGMYKCRANKVEVVVASGRVTDIKQVVSSDPGAKNSDYSGLYSRVIEAQSLQVDTVSGATLTSKAYLKAMEDALIKAEQK